MKNESYGEEQAKSLEETENREEVQVRSLNEERRLEKVGLEFLFGEKGKECLALIGRTAELEGLDWVEKVREDRGELSYEIFCKGEKPSDGELSRMYRRRGFPIPSRLREGVVYFTIGMGRNILRIEHHIIDGTF